MKRIAVAVLSICLPLWITIHALAADGPRPRVLAITINGPITPSTSDYIIKHVKAANDGGYDALVIEMDTPGGLMDSMRDIIKEIVNSKTPVIVFVSPNGARAASAGVFITMSAHLAAMAPQTNIGAAHPVGAGGEKMDQVMSDKVTNDAVAYLKAVASKYGRNIDWAERAVRNSVSITADEALKLKVIDIISNSTDELLSTVHGRKIETASGSATLKTSGASVERKITGTRNRILDIVSNPNVAYILMLLGIYGLMFEMTNPGSLFPGIIGSICLILAFYAFQTLPINYAGLMLILVAVILFVLETQIVSHGALTIGGVVALTIGSVMLFESSSEMYRLSMSVLLASVVTTTAFFVFIVRLGIKAQRAKPTTGAEGLIGKEGVSRSAINADGGMVMVHGELWQAWSTEPIEAGKPVIVEELSNLKIKVKAK